MLGFIGNIGTWEIIIILLIAVIVIGPSKLPEAARSFGKAMGQFKRATSGVKREFEEAILLDPLTKPKPPSEPVKDEVVVDESAAENDDSKE